MGKEIERKFLIDQVLLGEIKNGTRITQAYISTRDNTVVRIRLSGRDAYLTLKGKITGISRSEFEYQIPASDAEQIISELCSGTSIDKTRYNIMHAEHLWEIDVFHGENNGLIIAEIELSSETEDVELPNWIKEEVTNDPKYHNSNLLANPYHKWGCT